MQWVSGVFVIMMRDRAENDCRPTDGGHDGVISLLIISIDGVTSLLIISIDGVTSLLIKSIKMKPAAI